MIAMATSPAFTAQGFKNTFRSMTSDTQQGSVMGKYVVEKLGAKKVVIVDDRTAYGQGLADEFEGRQGRRRQCGQARVHQ